MHSAKDFLINFDSLVKNRLGPYHLVLKNEKNEYICPGWRSLNSRDAYCYDGSITYCCIFNNQLIFKDRGERTFPFLTTAGGDIALTQKNFNDKIRFIQ